MECSLEDLIVMSKFAWQPEKVRAQELSLAVGLLYMYGGGGGHL